MSTHIHDGGPAPQSDRDTLDATALNDKKTSSHKNEGALRSDDSNDGNVVGEVKDHYGGGNKLGMVRVCLPFA